MRAEYQSVVSLFAFRHIHYATKVTKLFNITNFYQILFYCRIIQSGKGWRINAEKLDKLLSDNPEIFRGVLKKDFDL